MIIYYNFIFFPPEVSTYIENQVKSGLRKERQVMMEKGRKKEARRNPLVVVSQHHT